MEPKIIPPGDTGMIFTTDIECLQEFRTIKEKLIELDGVSEIFFNMDVFPSEIKIHTSKTIDIDVIEQMVFTCGYHLIPKTVI
ncbi:hypothetical protein QQ008_21205 [Fulvivirgaceae bacterium BMA10]|uniref:HMA domain-containing protein n=1 Tax=Splendidivirga corallicola TaxID=3051826 RepID=A0ABT8KUT8_9BACT|nr:hypothetical protein [Fulvivirgaceae bacterium BMA10]